MAKVAEDPMDELLGPEEPEEAAEETARKEPEPEEEPAAEPTEADAEEEPDEQGDGEEESEELPAAAKGEASEGDAEEKPEKPQLPKSALKEIQRLREKARTLKSENEQLRGSAPPPEQQNETQPQGPQRIPVDVSEDGEQYVDPAKLQDLVKPQAPQVDQQAELARRLNTVKSGFIARNPQQHLPASQRLDLAADMLDALTTRTMQQVGYVTRSPDEWQQAMESTGALEEFRQDFPEIADVSRFAYRVAQVRMGNTAELGYLLNDYAAEMWPQLLSPESAEEGDAVEETGKLRSLPTGRPRSMAKKGDSGPKDEGLQSELKKLQQEVDDNPFGVDNEKKLKQIETIAKKLKIPL